PAIAPISQFRRNSTRGSVGLGKITVVQQLRHHIADRRRTHRVPASDGPGCYRFTGLNVLLNNCMKHVEMTRCQQSQMIHVFTELWVSPGPGIYTLCPASQPEAENTPAT